MQFILYFIAGGTQIIEGDTIEQAFAKAGYGAGAIRSVDWYDTWDASAGPTHTWNTKTKQWVRNTPIIIPESA